MKRKSLVERVKVRVAARKPKPRTWFDRLPPEHQQEFAEVKAAWRSGTIGTSALQLARDIIEECRESGIPICGTDGVREWLAKP